MNRFVPRAIRLLAVLTATIGLGLGAVAPAASAATIATAERHSCGVFSDGVRCWGASDAVGFLNPESGTPYATLVGTPLSGVTDINGNTTGGGGARFCAVASGASWCWGVNTAFAMGLGATSTLAVPTAVPSLGSGVSLVDQSTSRTCWIVNGGAQCAGASYLGNDTNSDSNVPVAVVGYGSGVTDIGAGWRSTCILQGGVVGCYGNGIHGQLGGGSGTAKVDGTVSLPGAATALDAAADSACAVVNGGVWCWGSSSDGALGIGDAAGGETPQQVVGLPAGSGVTQISGTSRHYCVLKSDGAVLCWGKNLNGQIGNGTTGGNVTTPSTVALPGPASSVSAGGSHSCAAVGSDFYCWGQNGYGQLGSGITGGQNGTPSKVLLRQSGTTNPTPTIPKAKITGMTRPVVIPRTRRVAVGTVTCPRGGGVCRVTVPRTVVVRFNRRAYTLPVTRLVTVPQGRATKVVVTVPATLRDAIGTRSVRVNVRVVATNNGGRVIRSAGATIRR